MTAPDLARKAQGAHRRRRSQLHSVILLMAMAALLAYCGWVAAHWPGVLWSLAASATMVVTLRRMPPNIVLRALNARALARRDAPVLYQILDELCQSAGVKPSPALCRVFGPIPTAFTIGEGEAAAIVLSASLLQTMNVREVRGILAHEIIHLRNGDLALMQLAVVVGRLTRVLSQIAFLLIFLGLVLNAVSAEGFPILPLIVLAAAPLGVNLLQLALSRTREAEADLEAAELTGDPYGLASALIRMRTKERARLRQSYPGRILWRVPSLFRDHPATDERIRHLLAMAPPPDRGLAEEPLYEFSQRRGARPWR